MLRRLSASIAGGLLVLAASGPALAQSWGGFYVGVPAGGGWSWTAYDAADVAGDAAGVGGLPAGGIGQGLFGGAEFGYSWQWGRLVIGAEASFNGSIVGNQVDCGDGLSYGYICTSQLKLVTQLTAHIGFARGNTVTYLMAGIATGRQSFEIREPSAGVLSWGSAVDTSRGWTVGIGNERPLSHGISVRSDLSLVRFPEREIVLTSPAYPSTSLTAAQAYLLASVSIIYRFGGSEPDAAPSDDDRETDVSRRVWLNFGNYELIVGDPAAPDSRMVYSGFVGVGAEAITDTIRPNGFVTRSMLGTSASVLGTMTADDYPPMAVPSSTTVSAVRNGRYIYRISDFGYRFAPRPSWAMTVYAGGLFAFERQQAFGCEQTGGNPAVCVPAVPTTYDYVTETSGWAALRLGVIGEIAIGERLSLRGEATLLPLAYQVSRADHWMTPDISRTMATSRGSGLQFDIMLDYALSDRLWLGIGARYWTMSSSGMTDFGGPPVAITTTSRHYGLLFEFAYKLDR